MAGGFLLGVYQYVEVFKAIILGGDVVAFRVSLIPGFIMSGGAFLFLVAILGRFATRLSR